MDSPTWKRYRLIRPAYLVSLMSPRTVVYTHPPPTHWKSAHIRLSNHTFTATLSITCQLTKHSDNPLT